MKTHLLSDEVRMNREKFICPVCSNTEFEMALMISSIAPETVTSLTICAKCGQHIPDHIA